MSGHGQQVLRGSQNTTFPLGAWDKLVSAAPPVVSMIGIGYVLFSPVLPSFRAHRPISPGRRCTTSLSLLHACAPLPHPSPCGQYVRCRPRELRLTSRQQPQSQTWPSVNVTYTMDPYYFNFSATNQKSEVLDDAFRVW
jgi:hypothetical protein